MANSSRNNVSVETITRIEDEEPRHPYKEITDAVQRTLDAKLKQAEERTNLTIAEAVKKALENQPARSTSEKKRKSPDFRLKGNKQRYETNEEIITSIDEAVEEINIGILDDARNILEAG